MEIRRIGHGTARNTSEVTTPKLPAPAPRSAQNRSASWVSSQWTRRPSARTIWTPIRRSEVTRVSCRGFPARRSVKPATPTAGQVPAGSAGALLLERLIHPAESCASADGGHATRDGYRIHRRHVDHHTATYRPPRRAVASTARRTLQSVPTNEQDRLRDVVRGRASHDGPRPDVMKPGVERLGQLVVSSRAGEDHIPGDHTLKCLQSNVDTAMARITSLAWSNDHGSNAWMCHRKATAAGEADTDLLSHSGSSP